MQKLKITKKQYANLLAKGLISESSQIILNENTDLKTLKAETGELLKFLYKESGQLSKFWENNAVSLDEIIKVLLDAGYIIKKGGGYSVPKTDASPAMMKKAIEYALLVLIESKQPSTEIAEDYPVGAENDPTAPYNQPDQPTAKPVSKPKLELVAMNKELGLFSDGKNLYAFYFGDIDGEKIKDYANRMRKFVGKDENGNNEYEYDDNYDIDDNTISHYVNDNLASLTKGVGVKAYENGVDLVKLDDELKNDLFQVYDKDKMLAKFLQPKNVEETTMAGASSGAFSAPLGQPIKKEIETVIGEDTTVASVGGQYDTPGLPGIGRNGEFKKAKKTPAQSKTQYAGGTFVEMDSCTKLNNNKSAQNGGCSNGAVDGVVKQKKTSASIIAPSMSESEMIKCISSETGLPIENVTETLRRNNLIK